MSSEIRLTKSHQYASSLAKSQIALDVSSRMISIIAKERKAQNQKIKKLQNDLDHVRTIYQRSEQGCDKLIQYDPKLWVKSSTNETCPCCLEQFKPF